MSYNQFFKGNTMVTNHEGEAAYKLSPELELYSTVCTMALQPKFYESAEDQVERISNLIRKSNHEFVAKLAVYARREMYLRSVPLLLIVELAKIHSGDNLVSKTIDKVIMRADEIAELLMCYQWRNPQTGNKKLCKLSHQIQIGLQKAFNKFDEYHFAKYDRNNSEVKLRDALFLVHPKAKDEAQQELFNKIADRALETPYTWETEMSALGQKKFASEEEKMDAFRKKWQELVASGKLGYMAMLRNLRNMIEVIVDGDTFANVLLRISDEDEVEKAKQFPFRYLAAYRELQEIEDYENDSYVEFATAFLNEAMEISSFHIKGFTDDTRTLIACDVSGSMYSRISRNSSIYNYEIGLTLAMLLKYRCKNVVTGIFADTWKTKNLPTYKILDNISEMHNILGEVGCSTNGYKVIEYLNENKIVMDKVMLFTDCQMWNSNSDGKTFATEWEKYKQIAPESHLYIFDLCGYGQAPIEFPREDVTLIAGWSDRIFDMLDAIEHGTTITEKINQIEL